MKRLNTWVAWCSIFAISACASASVGKKALIFGVTGQDGAYLSELLLNKGYIVHGVKRRASLINNTRRIDHLYQDPHIIESKRFVLHYGDVTDLCTVTRLIQTIQPDEVYNLAAQSHVQVSFELPLYTAEVDAVGVLNILEAIRLAGLEKTTRFYQASSSEMYGKVLEIPQTEDTPFNPRSPYAVAKVYGFWITKNYREAYGIFACNGILFNHESPLRAETFVTRKIARAVSRIKCGLQNTLYLGNLDAKRDWGHARDYVEAMWLMLQHDEPHDWVIATGENHSVREFVELAFDIVGIHITWEGQGLEEVGRDTMTGEIVVAIDARYFRPTEVDALIGNAHKAQELLGWVPKTSFKELVTEMMQAEMQIARRNAALLNG